MIKLIILLLCLFIVSAVAHSLWKSGRKILVGCVFFLIAGLVFPNPVAGLLFLGVGVAFLCSL